MSEKFTLQEFIDLCNYEGGLIEGFKTGLHAYDLDDEYPEIKAALAQVENNLIGLEVMMDTADEVMYEKTGKRWDDWSR